MTIKIDKITIRKPQHRISKKQVHFWTFYILLGKNKGTLNCVLYNSKLENLKDNDVLLDVVGDLAKQKVNDRWFDKLFIRECHLPQEYKKEESCITKEDTQLESVGDDLAYAPFEEIK